MGREVHELAADLNLPQHLGGYGIQEKDVPTLAEGLRAFYWRFP